jgi:beta-ureidopropionase / N-carbamoyl-L-amino-acid hydrolase
MQNTTSSMQDTVALSIDGSHLLERLIELGSIGRNEAGSLTRLAGSDQDKQGRDRLVSWLQDAELTVSVDVVGNIFGTWEADAQRRPLMVGSHIDTVIDAGIYDGCYGVLSGLAAVEALKLLGYVPLRPIVIAAFTNEEGVRYQPDMLGSLAFVGGLDLSTALGAAGTDGTVLGNELIRIGYKGSQALGAVRPAAYLELHIEQGPVLEAEDFSIGAVEVVQGISWQKIVIDGVANHAGTTPISHRHDAGYAAARIVSFLREYAFHAKKPSVATVGTMQFEPGAINIIPAKVTFTVDLRDPDEIRLRDFEFALDRFIQKIAAEEQVTIKAERLARFDPVSFDQTVVSVIEAAAAKREKSCRRMTSGAGHDAQMLARICPAAMIFVPSRNGISHNPLEFTEPEQLIAGANVLLDSMLSLLR